MRVSSVRSLQGNQRQDFSVSHGAKSSSAFNQRIGSKSHILIIGAGYQQIVRIMGNRLCHGSFFETEAFYEAEALCAGFMVAFDHGHLHHILPDVCFCKPVSDRQIYQALIGTHAVGNNLNHTRFHSRSRSLRRRNTEGFGCNRLADMHCFADKLRRSLFTPLIVFGEGLCALISAWMLNHVLISVAGAPEKEEEEQEEETES